MTRGMAGGGEGSFRMFHTTYFHRLSRYVFVCSAGDEQVTRDVVQETYRRVARHVRVFVDETVFWNWLTTIARSALNDERRKGRRYTALLTRFANEPAPSTERDVEDLTELLRGGLEELESEDRQLIEWKYFERRPVKEIAALLDASEGAIESRLGRLRRKLKDALAAQLKK